jgi:membrane-associated phospholipid phosphatase
MQYLDYQRPSKWKSSQLTKHTLLVALAVFIWFLPLTHNLCVQIDTKAFHALNGSLQFSHLWQLLWGYLNHPNENWLNVVLMAGINIIGVFSLPPSRRPAALAGILYFWLFFQLALTTTHVIFSDWLSVGRESPSLVLTPSVVLSDALNMPHLKVYSENSFPAGHTLVLFFWASFSVLYCKPWVRKIIYAMVIMFTLPRLFSGAHWLSDVVFTIFYALFWFELAIATPLFRIAIRNIEKLIRKIGFAA